MNIFERALIETRINKGEVIPDESLVRFSAHDREIIRLAEMLHLHWSEHLSIQNCVGIVYDLLDNYLPRIEWTDQTPEPDPYSEDLWRRIGGVRVITARLQVGGRRFKYQGRIPNRRQAREDAVDSLKRHIRRRVGVAVAEWADGQTPSEAG